MTCDLCGMGGATVRRVTRSYGRGTRLLVVERVPMVHCAQCGESYLTSQTMRKLDRIKSRRRTVARKRSVLVAEFI